MAGMFARRAPVHHPFVRVRSALRLIDRSLPIRADWKRIGQDRAVADLLARSGETGAAARAYTSAVELTPDGPERRLPERKWSDLPR